MSDKEYLNVIFFDGVCNLCSSVVQFIIVNDKANLFRFASLQSNFSKETLVKYNTDIGLDTFIYLRNGSVLNRSTAALYVLYDLGFPWQFFSIFLIIPKFLRDIIYRVISKYRYKVFGKKESCSLPSKDFQYKFID